MPLELTITNVMAVSLDGFIASHPGESDADRRSLGFTDNTDRDHLVDMMRRADAMIAGAETVRAVGHLFAEKNDCGMIPTWIIPTRKGFDPSSWVWREHQVPKCFVTAKD